MIGSHRWSQRACWAEILVAARLADGLFVVVTTLVDAG
jgi:hypothetical protein